MSCIIDELVSRMEASKHENKAFRDAIIAAASQIKALKNAHIAQRSNIDATDVPLYLYAENTVTTTLSGEDTEFTEADTTVINTAGANKSVNPLLASGVKPTDMAGHAAKDIAMAEIATQFIGEKAGNAPTSSTENYKNAWGDKANTGIYIKNDIVMISGSGPWRGVNDSQIATKFNEFYNPLLAKLVESGASVVFGNAKGMDKLIDTYLKNSGYKVTFDNRVGFNKAIKADKLQQSKQEPNNTQTVNVDSKQTGLEYALTNPTHTSPSGAIWTKGDKPTRDMLSKGIDYNGKHYADVEQAFQALKDKNESKTKPSKESSKNYKLMVDLITTKLEAYPRLVTGIANKGGLDYLNRIVHQPTNTNSVWETGGQDWFKSALVEAYSDINMLKAGEIKYDVNVSKKALTTITAFNEAYIKDNTVVVSDTGTFEYDPKTNDVQVDSTVDNAEYQVLLKHELLHHMTYNKVIKGLSTSIKERLVSESIKVRDFIETELGTSEEGYVTMDRLNYALNKTDLNEKTAELVAIIGAEPQIRSMIAEMADIKTLQELLKRFMIAVKEFFSGHTEIVNSAKYVIDGVDQIITKGQEAASKGITLAPGSNSLLVPAKAPNGLKNKDVQNSGFDIKSEFHLTVFGFPQGKEISKWLETDGASKMAKLQKLIDEADFSYTEKPELYKISRDREALVDWKDKSKGTEVLHEEAIIQLVNAPGIETFIKKVNEKFGFSFPVPFPHISLAVKGTKFGIGIANEAAFKELNPVVMRDVNIKLKLTEALKSATRSTRLAGEVADPIATDLLTNKDGIVKLEEALIALGVYEINTLLGAGASSIVYGTNIGALRLGSGEVSSSIKSDNVLQQIAKGSIGGIRYELYPEVDTTGITNKDVTKLEKLLNAEGINFVTKGTDNVGRFNGKLVVIDPGAVVEAGERAQKQTQYQKGTAKDYDFALDSKIAKKLKELYAEIEVLYMNGQVEMRRVLDELSGGVAMFQLSNKRKAEFEAKLRKARPELDGTKIDDILKSIEDFSETESKGNEKLMKKLELLALHWTLRGNLILPEDSEKAMQAVRRAAKNKVDVFTYDNPNMLNNSFEEVKDKEKILDPDTMIGKGFSEKKDIGGGITTYNVDNDEVGREASRKIMDSHNSETFNPWCLLYRDQNGLTSGSSRMWYNTYPGQKKIAFQDGKLVSFYGGKQWWDSVDSPSTGIPITIRGKFIDGEGRVRRVSIVNEDDASDIIEYKGYQKGINKEGHAYKEWTDEKVLIREVLEDGGLKTWWENGAIRSIELKDGTSIAGKESGILFHENLSDGSKRTWWDSGKTKSVELSDGTSIASDEHGNLTHQYLPDGTKRDWDRNGVLIRYTNTEGMTKVYATGRSLYDTDTYKDGTIKTVYKGTEKVSKEVLPDGTQKGYYANGQQSYEIKANSSKNWNEDGFLRFIVNEDGTSKAWHAPGVLSEDKLLDGSSTSWSKEGKVIEKVLIDRTRRKWNDKGAIISESLPDGSNKAWDDYTGKLIHEFIPNVSLKKWDSLGQLKLEALYKEGTKTVWDYPFSGEPTVTTTMLQKEDEVIKGAAVIDKNKILIDLQNRSTDTLPHEYAHFYIAAFRGTSIVQEAIKKWGSEEELVQAIGEQTVKQKGEVYGWWKEFSSWLKGLFIGLDKTSKEELVKLLTDAFLTRQELSDTIKTSLDIMPKQVEVDGVSQSIIDAKIAKATAQIKNCK